MAPPSPPTSTPSVAPVQPQVVLLYMAAGILGVACSLFLAYASMIIYCNLRTGRTKIPVPYGGLLATLRVHLNKLRESRRAKQTEEPESTFYIPEPDPFLTPTSEDAVQLDSPDWAMASRLYLDATPGATTTNSPLSPASSCGSPLTPLTSSVRGLGIIMEEDPAEADDEDYPSGPTIVVECDGDPQPNGNTIHGEILGDLELSIGDDTLLKKGTAARGLPLAVPTNTIDWQ